MNNSKCTNCKDKCEVYYAIHTTYKPCPWCGGSASFHIDSMEKPGGRGYPGNFVYYVKCDRCGAVAPNGKLSDIYRAPETARRMAIDNWNKRS